MDSITRVGFDINELDKSLHWKVKSWEMALKASMKRGLKELSDVGRILKEARAAMPHGQFERWIADKFDFSKSAAENYMNLHTFLQKQNGCDYDFRLAVAYVMASPSMPQAAIDELVERRKAGEDVKKEDAIEARERHTPPSDKPKRGRPPGRFQSTPVPPPAQRELIPTPLTEYLHTVDARPEPNEDPFADEPNCCPTCHRPL